MFFRTREPDQVATLIAELDAYQLSQHQCKGDGIVTDLFGTASTVNEIITCVAADPTHFTVVGSVSGALGTAVVGTAFTCAVCSFVIRAGATAWAAADEFAFAVTVPWMTQRTSTGEKVYTVTAQPNDIYSAVFRKAWTMKERWKKWAERQLVQ
jgi:hypothetical protein